MSFREIASAAVGFAIAGLACVSAPDEADGDRAPSGWNLVLISVDTLRADHLSCYGSETETPEIDRLARDGILFETVTSVSSTTLPAHASLLTGLTPVRHGVHDNVGFYLPQETDTLAAQLKRHGYRTGAFVGSFVLDARFGLDQGFDLYDDELGRAADELSAGWVAQRPGDQVVERAKTWLESEPVGARPFFAFVHLYDPHTPYEPPRGEGYRGEIGFVDTLVGDLLDWLEGRGLEESTVVVLTSDHGESLGEHGELTHGFFIYESTLRVPLLIRFPGGPSGVRVAELARLTDVAPTLLDILGLPPMDDVDGESLFPLGDGRERAGYAETHVPRVGYGWSELRSLRRGGKKLVLAPRPELYDLDADPDETTNLIADEPELARELAEELETLLTGGDTESARKAIDAETLEKLEALGYAGGAATTSGPLADPKDRLDVYKMLNDPWLASAERGEELQRALAVVAEVLQRAPGVPRAHMLHGELLLKAGRPAEAELAFSELVAIRGDSFEGHLGLGMARGRLGKTEQARAALERAVVIEPQNTKAYFQLAELDRARGDLSAAEDWLRRAIALSPDRFLTERLAELLLASGKRSESLHLIEELSRNAGEDPNAWFNVGQLLLSSGQTDSALDALRRSARLAPGDADVQFALGNALRGAGMLAESVSAYGRAVSLSPCFATAHGNLGTAHAELGSLEEAVASYRKAVACAPDYVLAHQNLAAVELQRGNLNAAIQAMEQAVRARPEDESLRSTLQELRDYARRQD